MATAAAPPPKLQAQRTASNPSATVTMKGKLEDVECFFFHWSLVMDFGTVVGMHQNTVCFCVDSLDGIICFVAFDLFVSFFLLLTISLRFMFMFLA